MRRDWLALCVFVAAAANLTTHIILCTKICEQETSNELRKNSSAPINRPYIVKLVHLLSVALGGSKGFCSFPHPFSVCLTFIGW